MVWIAVATLVASSKVLAHTVHQRDAVPTVDLGYEIHTATTNSTGQYHIFGNIPYAVQPVGDLRFSKPVLPVGNSSNVNNGSVDVMCMQASPAWLLANLAESYNISLAQFTEIFDNLLGQTEACLALDVYVPEGIFNNRIATKAPVVVWIHGGGFTSGSKVADSNPAGLIARSTLNNSEGFVYVAINYRLGLYGWLGGDDLTPNLGLYDQAVALEWVQKYIELFGGDAARVTVMGESAGAASIFHQVTAYGGAQQASFRQAIMQSPAFTVAENMTTSYELTMVEATRQTGRTVSTVADLAKLDSDTLKSINEAVVYNATDSGFVYGPSPDGTYVPALPQVLLAEGKFNHDVQVMVGHNSAELLGTTHVNITTQSDVSYYVQRLVPNISSATLNYILDVLYPATDYSSELVRAAQIGTDSTIGCSTRDLGLAFNNSTYNYLFAIPPGYHAEDIPYTFFNGNTSTLDDGVAVNEAIAYALQDYLIGFAMTGDPNKSPAGATVQFPTYGSEAQVIAFTSAALVTRTDDMDKPQCEWWQQAMVQGLFNLTTTATTTSKPAMPSHSYSSSGSRLPWEGSLLVGCAILWIVWFNTAWIV
ncbi:alpha/beta-hydrolase [Hyaloscypha variabilis F]|uniref:Carboxylic ester hydrolase n=1 Tax=Hyaloscypha variabilis (strain UAMH 11265 / GT02V1 / F) TaxID=1149755 RepID=A0A2J6R209_HYAVF|nr:alpha/beta-hydrolase [Hyaloscypha variabilis F]